MFRKTDPQQELFKADVGLPDSLRQRLKKSWAFVFQKKILPVLMSSEESFAILYAKKGRPNYSTGRMLGLCLLQELNCLSDQAALDAFGFDVRWQFALDVTPEHAYLSRRSLVDFRSRLVQHDPEMLLMRKVFEKVSTAAIEKLELNISEQRLDSTQITSNVCIRGRLDMFRKTLTLFLKSLNQKQMARVPSQIKKWFQEMESNDGWFGLGPELHHSKMTELARYIFRLLETFKDDEDVCRSEPYKLMEILFDENCEIHEIHKKGGKGKGKSINRSTRKTVQVKVKKKTSGATLQTPHDPNASYGHKGVGYSVHVTETCNNRNKPEIITDFEVHGAARSDVAKVPGVLNRLDSAGFKPDTLFADGGYPSPPSIVEIKKTGVELMAPVCRGKLKDDIMSRADFSFDTNGLVVACPAGYAPNGHRILSAQNSTDKANHAIFDGDKCRQCPMLERCPVRTPNRRPKGCSPRDTKGDFRLEIPITLVLRDHMYAQQQQPEWQERYKIRSGIEATMSQLKRRYGMKKLRVRRLPNVQFAVICKITACNIRRWARFTYFFNRTQRFLQLCGPDLRYALSICLL